MAPLLPLLLLGAGGLPDAQHVVLLVRVEPDTDATAALALESVARKQLADSLGTQVLPPPDPFPEAAAQRAEGERLTTVAKEKAGALEMAEALDAAEAAVRALEQAAVTPQGVKQLAEGHALAMIASTWNGKNAAAEEHARRAYLLVPSLSLDKSIATADDEALFKKAAKSVAAQQKGALEVASVPPGAQVFVDGQALGQTPLAKKDMPAGPHLVQLVLPWRHAVMTEVTVSPGGVSRAEHTFKDLPRMEAVRTALAKEPLKDKAGEWRKAAVELGADNAVVLVVAKDPKDAARFSVSAHLFALKDGARRRRAELAVPRDKPEEVAALIKDVLDLAKGSGASTASPGVASAPEVAPDEPAAAAGGGGGKPSLLPWIVVGVAVPAAIVLGLAGGAAVGAGASSAIWFNLLQQQRAADRAQARRRQAATTVLGY
ncbi:MAG: PEGA domain-containing protein [Deltaproteobacteria bacterium]|nr:PEGA domain-containing protein [Deltaproteobacteria bacterium]